MCLAVLHGKQCGRVKRAILPQHAQQRGRHLGQGVTFGLILQLATQQQQRAAQAGIAAGDALLQTLMGAAQDMVGTGKFVKTVLAVFVGRLQTLQTAPPKVTKLPHHHAGNQHADDKGARQLHVAGHAQSVQHKGSQHQQSRTAGALQEAIAHSQQQGRQNRPGEALQKQRVRRVQPIAKPQHQRRQQRRFQPRPAAIADGDEAVVLVHRVLEH